MKYTIEGLSQRICLKLGLDNKDICILRFIIDFYSTGKMKKIIHENKEFIWVHYETLMQEIPIIGIKDKGSLSERLKKLVKAGILERFIKKDSEGSFSYYHLIPEMMYRLQSDNYQNLLTEYEESEGGYRSKPGRGTGQNRDGVPVKTGDIDSSINNSSTININTNKGTPEINSGVSFNKLIHPENKINKCPENLTKINKTILKIVKEAFSAVPFTNVLPDDDAEKCNTKTYESIQNFLYNLLECKLKSAYTWNEKWVERNHIDFHVLREKATGNNGNSRITFEFIQEMLEKALKNYKLMQDEKYWPEKKETLTLNFKDFLYNYRQQTSWFLYCLFNEPQELKEKTAERIISDLPEKIKELIIDFGNDDSLDQNKWPKIAYYTKAKELYLWYEERAKKLCKLHTLAGLDGFRQYMADFHDLISQIYDFMETWRTPWTVNHFGMNCKVWNLFLKWLYKRYGYKIDQDEKYLNERAKRYDEKYPVKKTVKIC